MHLRAMNRGTTTIFPDEENYKPRFRKTGEKIQKKNAHIDFERTPRVTYFPVSRRNSASFQRAIKNEGREQGELGS